MDQGDGTPLGHRHATGSRRRASPRTVILGGMPELIEEGTTAPDFTLPDEDGNDVTLSAYAVGPSSSTSVPRVTALGQTGDQATVARRHAPVLPAYPGRQDLLAWAGVASIRPSNSPSGRRLMLVVGLQRSPASRVR